MQIPNMRYNQMFWSPGYNRFETTAMNIPQVIGEGDVISNVSPDGNIQYFFMPSSQWLPYIPNHTVKYNYIPNFNPNVASWFVRSISNPLPSGVFDHPYQRSSAVPIPTVTTCFNSDCNFNRTNPGLFQLKFHNDIWTSTTDLFYFCPGLRQCDWVPKKYNGSAAVQVELPVLSKTICHCEFTCNRHCHCPKKSFQDTFKNEEVSYAGGEEQSCMSVEEVRSEVKGIKSNKHSKKNHNLDKKSKKSKILCECDKIPARPDTSDKLVTTFADQKTGCTSETGKETQTIFKNNSFTNTMAPRKGKDSKRSGIQPEIRRPKTSYAKKDNKSDLSKTKLCNSDCSSGITSESCYCNSETE